VSPLLAGLLDDPAATWSVGVAGAVAEFARDVDEMVWREDSVVATPRGGLRLEPPPGVRPLAYETPAGPDLHWTQVVAWCLPVVAAQLAGRRVVTELGPDSAAVREHDREAVLFDLGLGAPTVDACVRTADPELLEVLRSAEGRSLLESPAFAALVEHGPHRVWVTACGRVEVYTPIPPPDGRSPLGPHTHVLPHLLATGRTHAATVPVPSGWVPVAQAYPAHPTADHLGRPHRFDAERLQRWSDLLAAFGDADLLRLKAQVQADVRAGRRPSPRPTAPTERAAIAVALRQLAHTDGIDPAEWRPLRVAEDVTGPAGDPNA
jgi:hypothetical protein